MLAAIIVAVVVVVAAAAAIHNIFLMSFTMLRLFYLSFKKPVTYE